jgi:hypothetical protein
VGRRIRVFEVFDYPRKSPEWLRFPERLPRKRNTLYGRVRLRSGAIAEIHPMVHFSKHEDGKIFLAAEWGLVEEFGDRVKKTQMWYAKTPTNPRMFSYREDVHGPFKWVSDGEWHQ